jgi:2-polyprenyl-3-methyl-5-hydroxy-6-metoxy-1,4-benzoquinol methylase
MIRRLVRLFGYDLINRQNVKRLSHNRAFNKQKYFISREESEKALKTVGRKPMRPFQFFQRPYETSTLINELENRWWNGAGNIIEKVWVLPDDICSKLRYDYVKKASAFFRQASVSTILDLGCGSGWIGRMIADENLIYVGIDFSETQISIAKAKSAEALNSTYLSYYCINDFASLPELKDINGIIIHAFLHHLYGEELNTLFKKLQAFLPKGCKFFIMEPVYPKKVNRSMSEDKKQMAGDLIQSAKAFLSSTKLRLINENKLDCSTENELDALIVESNRNGFFFSPKEVPFKFAEIESFLSKYGIINNFYYCGVLNLEAAQLLALIPDKNLREDWSNIILPFINKIDQFVIESGYFDNREDQYLFTCFEFTLDK